MLNTRLNLNHLSFTHLICEFLIICGFLLLYIQYLFITFACYIYLLLIFRYVVSFALLQKLIVEIYLTLLNHHMTCL